ncbi:MAG TPA: hypothetical protein VNJ04_00980 [Gemmatimonadaceae bacterium]|nr:hypothetical protein [Gemmatimonadaceae bacterium]
MAVLWVLGALALVWVLLMVGAMTGMDGMMRGGSMMGGSMMGGSMMNGRPKMEMGMMVAMGLTWVIMLGLIGVLVYLLIVAVRSKGRKPANDVGLHGEGSEPRER